MLSHDLLEGALARAGHLSDVLLFEDYPSSYAADASRRSRWMRGDWQIAAWLLGRVPGGARNPVSWLSQWKILDNLRRSLAPSALTLLLLLGWLVLSSPWFWTLSVLGIVLIPPLAVSLVDLLRKREDALLSQHLAAAGQRTDLQKLFEMRILVEGFCARLAAERATEAQIAEMEEVVVQLEQTPNSDTAELMAIDQTLHRLMYEAADNKFLADTLNSLHALSLRLWHLAVDKLGDLKQSIEDHRPVIEALKARDGARAEWLIQQHISRFQQQIRTVL